ncbi:hypothetical protein GCM10010441_38340 [Kitasatospora paracochleata]|uniref:Uncharacterized protein n=1 Tax=Kitasatospora paracochleata TaxID=58354 RepID=A0ABT1IPS7_9ACTN|nr:hypothetical protein [Kitasatospora paracochleata]MCP2306916.1 hypothetical protein [Kitasatospora paracochleata]
MKSIVAGQCAVDRDEFAELALGVDEELFAGVPGESAVERRARMDAARDVLADLRREDPDLAAYAERLMNQAPVPLRTARRTAAGRVSVVLGVAA